MPPAALATDGRTNYEAVARYLLDGARRCPRRLAFRPTPEVRTFAQVVGHVAEAQYIACSIARGQEYKPRELEQNLSKKAELVPALEAAVGFCRESWSKLAPGAMADPVTRLRTEAQQTRSHGSLHSTCVRALRQHGDLSAHEGDRSASSAKSRLSATSQEVVCGHVSDRGGHHQQRAQDLRRAWHRDIEIPATRAHENATNSPIALFILAG